MDQRSYSASAPSQRSRQADPARLAAYRTLREVVVEMSRDASNPVDPAAD